LSFLHRRADITSKYSIALFAHHATPLNAKRPHKGPSDDDEELKPKTRGQPRTRIFKSKEYSLGYRK
jgi:hypothetical protein